MFFQPFGKVTLMRRSFRPLARLVLALVFAAFFIAAMSIASRPRAQEHHSNPWLLSWIPSTCCVTNDCCWQISATEVQPRPNDEWLIVSTGQVRKRTDWSPDGRYYRCACDYDESTRRWVLHQGANTRCLFVPMQSVDLSLR